jgi:hypothetical protein
MGKLLQLYDFKTTDFSTVYPDIKPGIGGVWFARWDQFNPGDGEYNNSLIRNWLAAEAKNRLQDGTAKPLIAFLLVHTAPDGTNAQGVDYSPAWVRAITPTLTATAANGTTAKMPAYNNTLWWGYLTEAVKAFALELDGQPQVAYVAIGHGCDGELWPMKAPWNNKIPGGTERTFGLETVKLLDVYKQAFTRTPLIVNATPGSGRKTFTTEAIKRGIGVHMCGAQVAAQNAHGWGHEYGTWDMLVDAHAAGVPAVAESTFGMGSEQFKYWTILGMLGMHIDAMDCHPDWFKDVPAETWNWATQYMGVTAKTAPGAWCVLRDYDSSYPPVQWTSKVDGMVCGQSDWQGDFQFYLRRTSPDADAPRVEDHGPSDAVESRQCRLVSRATFEIDPAFAEPPYELSIRYLDQDATILVDVGDTRIASHGTGQWVTATQIITSRTFTVTSNQGAYVHMLSATPTNMEPEPPEPPEPDPELDTAAIWAAVNAAQAAVDEARRDAYAAYALIEQSCGAIAEAARQLQDSVTVQEDARARAVAAQEQCDEATVQLAAIRAELEKAGA